MIRAMQILILIVAAWYLGRALVGAGRHANGQQAVLALGLGLVWLPLLHILPTSFGFDYFLFGAIAVAGIVYDVRHRRPWPLIEGDFEDLLPHGRVEWACAAILGLALFLSLFLLAGPQLIPAGLRDAAQSIHELARLGKREYDGDVGVGLAPLIAGLYHMGGLYGARLLVWFWALMIVCLAALLGHRLGGRRCAWWAGALCAAGPWIASFGLAFPDQGWQVLALLLFASALLPEGGVAPAPRLVVATAAPIALAAAQDTGAPLVFAAVLLAPAPFLRPESGYGVWLKCVAVIGAAGLALLLAIFYYGVDTSVMEAGLALWSQIMRPEHRAAWLLNPGAAALAFGLPALFLGGRRMAVFAAAALSAGLLGAWTGAPAGAQLGPLVLLVVLGAAWVARGGRGARIACLLAAILSVAGVAFLALHAGDRIGLLSGRETSIAYLERHVPRYGALAYCNTQHPNEAVALFEPVASYLGAYGFVLREATILHEDWPRNLIARSPLQRPRLMVLPSRETLALELSYSDVAIERLEVLRRGDVAGFRVLQRMDLPQPVGGVERVWVIRVPGE